MTQKLDSHALISALKELYSNLDRIPTRDEFIEFCPGANKDYRRVFGDYSTLAIAAGLPIKAKKEKKIDNSIFTRDIDKHLEQHVPPKWSKPGPFPSVASLSDIHWPFHKQHVIDYFYVWIEENQPEYVILNGDAWDMYSHAKFPRSHNVFTPREEQRKCREENEKFWKEVQKRCPKAKCIQMMGNHDIRPLKRIMEEYPEAEDWVKQKLAELFTFEGVKTIHDPREEFMLNDTTAIFHGYRSQLGSHRDYTLLNCFNGHTHRGGTVFRQVRGTILFEANSGYAGDPTAKGLTYTAQKMTEWTWGFTVCDKWGPRFIPA